MASAQLRIALYVTIIIINSPLQILTSRSPHVFTYPRGIIPCKTYKENKETTLDCSNRRLTDIPPLDQNATTQLNVSHNELIQIKGKPFQNLSLLTYLDLSYNAISDISITAFAGLQILKFLHVRDNELVSFPQDIFMHLKHLIYLDISNNLFTKVPPSLNWTHLQSLRSLRVSIDHNEKPTSIEIDKDFQKLKNLASLFIYANELSSNITQNTFQYLNGLPIEHLVIAWRPHDTNTYVDRGIFISLPNLRELILPFKAFNAFEILCRRLRALIILTTNDNEEPKELTGSSLKKLARWKATLSYLFIELKIEKILNFAFKWAPFLELLSLERNNIQSNYLSKYVFSGLDRLKNLSLAENFLKTVPSHTFIAFQNGSLQALDLSANGINKIAPDAFSLIPHLKYLCLSDNTIVKVGDWISTFTNLISLDIGEIAYNLYGTYFRSSSSSLQILNANDAEAIYFLPVNMVKMCSLFPNLKNVNLSHIKHDLSRTSLAIRDCPDLLELDLSYSIRTWNLSTEGIYLPNLKHLYLAGNRLTYVNQFYSSEQT